MSKSTLCGLCVAIDTTLKELVDQNDENNDCGAKSAKIEDMEDLPPYDFVTEFNEKMKANKKVH